jgi:hypothetical protein
MEGFHNMQREGSGVLATRLWRLRVLGLGHIRLCCVLEQDT